MNTSRVIKHSKTVNFPTTLHLFGVILALAQMGPGAARSAAYDLSTDYSATSNPNGVWSYGAMTNIGGSFIPFNVATPALAENGVVVDVWGFGAFNPEIWHNGTGSTATSDGAQGVFPPGTVCLFPGSPGIPYGFGIARFTAPQAGSYLLQTTVHNYLVGPSAGDSDFRVLDNGAQLFLQQIALSGVGAGAAYSTSLNLAAGETIDFVVGRGLDGNGDASGITIQASLTPVPEPTSLAFVGLGAAALMFLRRRK